MIQAAAVPSYCAGKLAALAIAVAAPAHEKLTIGELKQAQPNIAILPFAAPAPRRLRHQEMGLFPVLADPKQRVQLPVIETRGKRWGGASAVSIGLIFGCIRAAPVILWLLN